MFMMQVQFPSPSSPYPASLSELIFNYKRSVTTLEKKSENRERESSSFTIFFFFFHLLYSYKFRLSILAYFSDSLFQMPVFFNWKHNYRIVYSACVT